MQEKFHYPKELRWLRAGDITINEDYRIYQSREREDLKHTIKKRGIIEPLTTGSEAEKYPLLNGFDRYDIVIATTGPDTMIPVWVISAILSDIQKKELILDLARQKRKTYTDLMNEFHLYNQVVPNNQGKSTDAEEPINRFKLIAGLMGISTSKLSMLLRIDKARPSLLVQVDNEHRTLSQADEIAKTIKRTGRKLDPKNTDPDSFNPAKVVDMEPKLTHCPSCNRPLDAVDWDDLPKLFSFKRNERNNQTDWLKELTEEDIKELENTDDTHNTSNHE